MMNGKTGARSAGAAAGLAAALFLTLGTAWAHPMGGPPGMGDHCEQGMGHGMGHGMSLLQPHNAATHFLKMAPFLNLSDAQVQQLTKLRDQYIDSNAKTEEMLKAAYSDLARAMFSDEINTQQTMGIVNNIGKMESQLWQAYLQQLQQIRGLLTAEQKQALKDVWASPRHGMDDEDMSGGGSKMPMGHGSMNHGKTM